MNKTTQSVLIVLLGGLLISITVSGRYTSYVKPGFGPLLVIAGVILILVGVLSIVTGIRGDRKADLQMEADAARGTDTAPSVPAPPVDHSHEEADGHGHSHDRSKAPWLILAPILVLLLLAPPALGADAVNRNAGSQALQGLTGVASATGAGADVAAGGSSGGYAPNDGSGHGIGTKAFAKQRPTMKFAALPAGQDPALTLKEFIMRALYDGDNSVSDNNITVVGFIAGAGDGYTSGYSLARMTISCCAADASPMRVHIDAPAKYAVNTWVSAVISAQVGTADSGNDYVPTVDVVSMTPISQPSDPYEH
ncbi:TIGR03943 family protein [Nakamurella panacisegetis]|uniref:TIGR03943 family protein n=1 Tax=Nakamurella panacisegetis TaxID=1090615 RepID=A0A1H0T4J5_9ACTN|nr:TIGR03943 family protein [Nakamurella panacisegetis]SDP48488.1 TIGR03943 family protein [Nakamurella panacisegetis]